MTTTTHETKKVQHMLCFGIFATYVLTTLTGDQGGASSPALLLRLWIVNLTVGQASCVLTGSVNWSRLPGRDCREPPRKYRRCGGRVWSDSQTLLAGKTFPVDIRKANLLNIVLLVWLQRDEDFTSLFCCAGPGGGCSNQCRSGRGDLPTRVITHN